MAYPPPYQPYQQPYMVVQRPPSNGQAIGAMVLGIIAAAVGVWAFVPFVGLISAVLGFLPAVIAVILGHLGLNGANRMGGTGRSQAITGFILGYVTLAIIIGTTLFWIIAIIGSSNSTS